MRPWTWIRRAVPFAVVSAVAAAALVAPQREDAATEAAAPDPAVVRELSVPATTATGTSSSSSTDPSSEEGSEPTPAASEPEPEVEDTEIPEVEPDPGTSASPSPAEPAAPGAQDEDEHGGGEVVAELTRTETRSYGLVGVTWEGDGTAYDVDVSWRTDGRWSEYEHLHLDGDQTEGARGGTEPRWVGDADGVAVRVSSPDGSVPTDLKVATVDPGEGGEGIVPAGFDANKPPIITRGSWGAAATKCGSSDRYGDATKGATVHHTAGTNSYSESQSAAIVRSTQSYHMKSRDWCDIGYNFLVDKYGNVFEGRYGGVDEPVRGAHAGNWEVNESTVGISMMGEYSNSEPTRATKVAVADTLAWRFWLAGVPAYGTYRVGGLTLNRVAGHRDVTGTACPGTAAYGWMKTDLRAAVDRRVKAQPAAPAGNSPIEELAESMGSAALGKLVREEWGNDGRRREDWEKANLYWTESVGKAYAVSGAFLTEYDRVGQQREVLQFPTSGVQGTSKSSTKIQRFQHGSIYRTGTGRAYALYGPIWEEYKRKGQTRSSLGVPTGSIYSPRSGYLRANFTEGSIEYNTKTGEFSHWYTHANGGYRPAVVLRDADEVTFTGHGFGHGIGMSQYGAQGQAKAGRSFQQILSTYYPGTSLEKRSGRIRILLSEPTGPILQVKARDGLKVRWEGSNKVITLPTSLGGERVEQWRIKSVDANKKLNALQYPVPGGRGWRTYGEFFAEDAQFEALQRTIDLVLPNGQTRTYHSMLRLAYPSKGSTSRRVVNITNYNSYVQGVVTAEMPSSWDQDALRAQAVAARTYALRSINPSNYYDICDTTSCQVYRGVAGESSAGNSAVAATEHLVLLYGGKPALTQYSSSSGGYTAKGSQPYLKSVRDSWDSVAGNSNHSWKVVLSAKRIEQAYPGIGDLVSIKVYDRAASGSWGGRVGKVVVTGTRSSVTTTGEKMRFALGLKSHYFRLG